MPEALICRRCGAPLPALVAGTTTCAHCGTVHGHAHASGPITQVASRGCAGRALVVAGLAVAVCGVGVGVVGVFLGTADPAPVPVVQLPEAPPAAPSPAPAPPPEPAGPPSWRTLGTAEVGRWLPIEPPPVVTPLEAFEPSLHLEWAETIARVWAPDAVVIRVDADGISRAGGLDLVHDPEASVRFVTWSPARSAASQELAKVSREVPPEALVVSVGKGEVRVMIGGSWRLDAGATTPVRSPCTLAQLAAAAGSDLPERPFFEARLDWREPYAGLPAWLWDVGSGVAIFPDDCTRWTLSEARKRR